MPLAELTAPAKARPAPKAEPVLAPERPQDGVRVDALVAEAFGPGRFAKSAERLREGNAPDRACSVVAWAGADVVGAVRLWPIAVGGAPVLFLGPIAVDARWRRRGLGARLVEHACAAGAAAGERLVMLVGDRRVFESLGFHPVPPDRIVLPGPVDPARIFVRDLQPGAAEAVSGPAGLRAP